MTTLLGHRTPREMNRVAPGQQTIEDTVAWCFIEYPEIAASAMRDMFEGKASPANRPGVLAAIEAYYNSGYC